MKILIFILLFTSSLLCTSQQNEHKQNSSRLKAFNNVENIAKCLTKNNNFLLFSIADKWYLIIIENESSYYELFIKDNCVIGTNKISKPNEILDIAFNKEIYHTEFIGPGSYPKEIKYSTGSDTYFVFVDKNKNLYGEMKATTIMIPPPINERVYNYLLINLLNLISSTNEDNE